MTETAEQRSERTHYETIGVGHDVTSEELKRVYRKLARELHPDVNPSSEAEQRFKEISEAYAVLSDPARREEYDLSLLEPPEPEEPPESEEFHDEWGDAATWDEAEGSESASDADVSPDTRESEAEEEWGEVVLDDVVVEDDQPPAPSGDTTPLSSNKHKDSWVKVKDKGEPKGLQWPGGDYPQPTFVYPGKIIPRVLIAGGVALLALAVLTLTTGTGPKQIATPGLRMLALLAGVVVGFALAALNTSGSPQKPTKAKKPRPQPESKPPNPITTLGLVLLCVLAVEVLVPPEWKIVARAVEAAVVTCGAAMIWLRAQRDQKALDQFLPIKTLRENNVYGSLPGGVAADLLSTDCSAFYAIPSLRMMRSSQENAAFSHALVVGNRIALLRAIQAPQGHYRWSGPSLLRQVENAYPEEVMRGPYGAFLRKIKQETPDAEIESWLFVYTGTPRASIFGALDPNMPRVVSPVMGIQEVGEFLVGAAQEVRQERVVKTVSLLS